MNETFMKEKPVLPLLLSMALPMVLSMLINSLYNIVDSYFVAKISEDAMTALSLVFPIQNFISAMAIGFGVGINAVIAFHLGAGNQVMANRAATQGLALSVVHAVVLGGAGVAVMPAFLRMFTSSESVVSLGLRYSVIVFSFSLSIMAGIAFEKIFQAVGRMKVTMVGLASGCVANIILDPLFIFGFGPFPAMGIEGAALATGIGQTISLLIYLAVYFMRPLSVRIGRQFLRPDGATVRRLYAVGIPATLKPGALLPADHRPQCHSPAYSGVYILVLGVYYKLQTFLYLPANGFVQGMRPLVGYNYGAGEYGRVRKLYNLVLIMSGAIMAAGTVICLLFPAQLMGLFTETPETIEAGKTALRIISAGFLVSASPSPSCGALEGLGKGAASLIISLARYVVVILPAAFLLSRLFGAAGVWNAFWVTEVISAAVSLAVYRRATAHRA